MTARPVLHLRDIRADLLVEIAILHRRQADPTSLLRRQRTVVEKHEAALLERVAHSDGLDRAVVQWRLDQARATLRLIDTFKTSGSCLPSRPVVEEDRMPSLQVEVPRDYDVETRRRWAQDLGAAYARIMQTTPDLVTVAIHALGPGSVWRCTAGEPREAALVMCDVRAGRPAATRAELARAVIAICAGHGGLEPDQVKVEFTQHPGDDMYHPHLGGFNHDWTGDERPRG